MGTYVIRGCPLSDYASVSKFSFFDAVVAARSVLLDDETALEGATTVSLETQTDMVESDVLTYIEDNFPQFLTNLRYLSKEDQELLLGYYVLAKTQTSLALLHRSTQTLCSARIRLAMQKMGTYLIMGPPTPELMRKYFDDVKVPVTDSDGTRDVALENLLPVPLSKVVELYSRTRSFQRVAEVLQLHRPEVRRVMSLATKVLGDSDDRCKKAIGAYLFDMIDKASASGAGFSRRKMEKQGNIFLTTSSLFGDFRVDVTHPDWGQFFSSRANR
jgi:hypothetical protein